MKITKGSIVLVRFGPEEGSEVDKVRPALVLQNDWACELSSSITLIPFTSRPFLDRIFEVFVGMNKTNGLLKNSVLLINQIMTYDKVRVLKVLGKLDEAKLAEVYSKIDIHLGR